MRYAEKSKDTNFIIKNGKDQLKLKIESKDMRLPYKLFINDVEFTNLYNQHLNTVVGI